MEKVVNDPRDYDGSPTSTDPRRETPPQGQTHAALLSNAQDQWPALRFPPGLRLRCLRGWDRLRAGWELLPPRERWWTVDLYLSGKETPLHPGPLISANLILGISKTLERSLREGFSNEGQPSDGQIYRNIRQYILQDDLVTERQWWARLSSKNKRRDLRRLLRHERYTTALDTLLPIIGLWEGEDVRGGMWKRMMDLRCEEVGCPRIFPAYADETGP